MKTIQFECPIDTIPGFRADAVMDDTVYEVIVEPRDARKLRSVLMEMARVGSSKKVNRVVLALEEPSITISRLHEEWEGAASVIRPDLFVRLSMAVHQSGKWSGIPASPDDDEAALLEEIIQHEIATRPASLNRNAEASL